MPKKAATEIGCSYFDQPDLQSLNNYKKFFSILRLQFWMLWGVWYTVRKVFSKNILQATKFL